MELKLASELEDSGDNDGGEMDIKKVFTLFSGLNVHVNDPTVVCSGYEYYLFFPHEEITTIIESVESSITFDVLIMWLPMYCFASVLYFFICLTFVTIIGKGMIEPVNKLTERIKAGAISIHNLRK